MRKLFYTLFILLSYCLVHSQEKVISISLQAKPVLPISKGVLDKLSCAIRCKKKCEQSIITYYAHYAKYSFIRPNDLTAIELNNVPILSYRDSNHLNFTYQQNIYKGLLYLTKVLQQWPAELNDQQHRQYLPQELILQILSYLNKNDSAKFFCNVNKYRNYIYDNPINILLKNRYYISHNYLFSLLSTLDLFTNKDNNYVLGHFCNYVELPSYLNPYIEALLYIIKNPSLVKECFKCSCAGEFKFLYYGGFADYSNYSRPITNSDISYNYGEFDKNYINSCYKPSAVSQYIDKNVPYYHHRSIVSEEQMLEFIAKKQIINHSIKYTGVCQLCDFYRN